MSTDYEHLAVDPAQRRLERDVVNAAAVIGMKAASVVKAHGYAPTIEWPCSGDELARAKATCPECGMLPLSTGSASTLDEWHRWHDAHCSGRGLDE